MTQRFIRRLSGLTLLHRFYLGLLEPRVVTAVYGAVYAIFTFAGIYLIFYVTGQLEHIEGGRLLVWIIAAFLVVGGAGGVAAIVRGDQWAERFVVAIIFLGALFYWLTISVVAVTLPGHRLMGVIGWLLSLILVALRLHWIVDRPHRPGSHSDQKRKKRQRRRQQWNDKTQG